MPNIHFKDGTVVFMQPAQISKELEEKRTLCKRIQEMKSILPKDTESFDKQSLINILHSDEIEIIIRGVV